MGQILKILAISGIRSEYDILYPILEEIRLAGHELLLVISGAHLSEEHNNTQEQILLDGFNIVDRIDSLLSTDRLVQRAKGVGMLIQGLAQTVERTNPDFILVVGDREESIASALVGNYMNKLVVHIGGGDPVFGNSDDPIRFAVSKLANLHCCAAQEHAQNLRNIGEEDFRIQWTGNAAYVNIDKTEKIQLEDLSKLLDLPISEGNYLVLIQHPLSSEVDESYKQMGITLHSLKEFYSKHGYQVVCIAPNSDPGSYLIRKLIKEYHSNPWFHSVQTLPRLHFVNLMRHAKVLVGNSSMGIVEAPYYKLPVVNLGNRQKGRINAGNVEFVTQEKVSIVKALENACFDLSYRKHVRKLTNPYGDGSAARKILEAIENVDLDDSRWYVKRKLCP